jgi:hypothetical protein
MNSAPIKTPILDNDEKLLSWQWQRWYSDLFEKIKELEKRIKDIESKT